MKYHGPKDRLEAAQSEDTPPAELDELSQSEYVFVREAVAANPSTPSRVLSAMVPNRLDAEDDFKVALSLIKNSNLQPDLASAIAGLVVQAIGQINPRYFYPTELVDALVRCTTAPTEALLPMADPTLIPKHIRGRIAATGVRTEVLTRLADDPSGKISARAKRALKTDERPNQRLEDIAANRAESSA